MLLADSARRAGSLDREKIRDALAATRGFRGVAGEITFDANRNPINKPAVIISYENGAIVYVKTVTP
jgi:branched-chain amino acid transport system substrate-binding protein